ncbi:hypothetical protein AgCh_005101 [Apium graveolens]
MCVVLVGLVNPLDIIDLVDLVDLFDLVSLVSLVDLVDLFYLVELIDLVDLVFSKLPETEMPAGGYDPKDPSYSKMLSSSLSSVLSWTDRKLTSRDYQSESTEVDISCDYIRQKVEQELSSICGDIMTVIDEHLIPSCSAGESTVFYYKMKGAYHRYLAEFKVGNDRKEATDRNWKLLRGRVGALLLTDAFLKSIGYTSIYSLDIYANKICTVVKKRKGL